MEPKFVNGSTVSRVWGDSSSELIAAFQYESNAVEFAKMAATDETRPTNVFYVVSCHLNGKITIVRPPEKSLPAAKGSD